MHQRHSRVERRGWVVASFIMAGSAAGCTRPAVRLARVDETRASDGVAARMVTASNSSEFRVATFNAGLAVGVVKLASERTPRVAEVLPTIGADLVCLQEVWFEEQWSRVIANTSTLLPHAVRLPPAAPTASHAGPSEGAACSVEEIAPVEACVRQNCPGLASDQLAACALANCRSLATRLSTDCVSCLALDPTGTADAILKRCVGSKTTTQVKAVSPTQVVAYGGSYGLGLLTRETILAEDVLRLETDLNPRAAIYVRLRTEALGEVDAFCTHLTPDDSNVIPPPGKTWRDVHTGEVVALSQWIDAKSDGVRPVILLGDLNSGPEIGTTISSRFPEDYAKLIADGFADVYTRDRNPPCTFCYANPLNDGPSAGAGGTIIDHIFTKHFSGRVKIVPILRDPIEVLASGTKVLSAYSDHYGLLATFTRDR